MKKNSWLASGLLVLMFLASVYFPASGQQQQSGGAGSSVAINAALPAGANLIGKVGIDQTTPGGTNGISEAYIGSAAISTGLGTADAGTQRVSIASNSVFSIGNTAFALNGGSAIIGYTRYLPPGCASLTSDVVHDTVGVATGAGTSVSAVTGCIERIFVNNITNSPVTFRLADKTATPIIWLGGNADFSIPANSNMGIPPMEGITMANGITAISGTGAALNLHIVTRE